MHAHLHPDLLVGKQIDVVVAGTHGPQVIGGEVQQVPSRRERRILNAIEHGVVDGLAIAATDPEADPGVDLVHDHADITEVPDGDVGARGHVAAADVIAHVGRADVFAVGDRAPDRLAVAQLPVGAQHRTSARLDRHARRELIDDALLVLPDNSHALDHGTAPMRNGPARRGGPARSVILGVPHAIRPAPSAWPVPVGGQRRLWREHRNHPHLVGSLPPFGCGLR